MGLLTQVSIQDVEAENEVSLVVTSPNNMQSRLQGEDEMATNSWHLQFKNAEGDEIKNCNYSYNEMFFIASDKLMSKLTQVLKAETPHHKL